MTHGIGGGTGPEVQAQLQEPAQTIYAVGGALHIGFLAISCVASRFSEMNPFKAAAYGLVFIGVLLLLNLIILQHIHDVNISVILLISSAPSATSSLESGCTRVVENCFLTEAKARFATLTRAQGSSEFLTPCFRKGYHYEIRIPAYQLLKLNSRV